MRSRRPWARLVVLLLALAGGGASRGVAQPPSRPVVVASKPFGESYLLCEMFAQLLEARGIGVERRPGLGATEIAFAALRTGAIDVYPEYTGTGLLAILRDTLTDAQRADPRLVYAHVARMSADRWGVRWLPPLGFENTYAIAVRRETAARDGLRTLGDLARAGARLRAGFTSDFIGRADGLPGLARAYGLTLRDVRPLAPAVKYQALASGAVDVIDGYSTDGLLARYDLVTLTDDRRFFPPYEAAAVVSATLARERPDAVAALTLLSGRLTESRMRALNRRVEVDGEEVGRVAADALATLGLVRAPGDAATVATARATAEGSPTLPAYLWDRRASVLALTLRHLALVAAALGVGVLVGVPLGLGLERARRAAEPTLGVLGAVQTVPSLALLAFMIPLLGVGTLPALVALWLYALYPIVRATFTGLREADPAAVEAAEALGATPAQRLLLVRLPLAAPVIMAGVRTAAILTVGAATLAALIGAGGLGEPIVTGLALADTRLVLSGALPAAALALLVDGALALVERLVTPPHRRATGSRVARRRGPAGTGLALLGAVLLASGGGCTRARPTSEPPAPVVRTSPRGAPVAAVFAPGVISDAREQWRITFTPDGTTAYFAASDGFFPITRQATIYVSHRVRGTWTAPVVASFSGTHADIDPFVAPDGQRLYFSSIRPVDGVTRGDLDVWYVERTPDGWGAPVRLGDAVNSPLDELYASADARGTLYVASGPRSPQPGRHFDIFRAERAGDGFAPREALPAAVNTVPVAGGGPQDAWDFNPEISVDGTTLVFTSLRPGGHGLGDLYVSRRVDGAWTPARNLGPLVNTAADEYHPTLSRDGRTLYFVRRGPAAGDFLHIDARALDLR